MDWHFQKRATGERQGPVSAVVIEAKIAGGELLGDDVAWRVGLPAWAPLSTLPEFSPRFAGVTAIASPSAVASIGASGPAPIGYYTPRGDAPARVKANLAKFAASTGPTGDWPLSDGHINQLAEAVRYRKRILAGYNSIRLIAALQAVGFAIFAVLFLNEISRGRISPGAWTFGITGGLFLVLSTIGFIAGSATWYCRAWGSLVMFILALIGTGFALVSLVSMVNDPTVRDPTPVLAGGAIGLCINLAFVVVFWRAWRATPAYLATSVWCQEALAVAEKSK